MRVEHAPKSSAPPVAARPRAATGPVAHQPFDVSARARTGHAFQEVAVTGDRALEHEADRIAASVVGGATLARPAARRAPAGAIQRQEKPPVEPSVTQFPGEAPADPEAEKRKKSTEALEKLGTGLALLTLKEAGGIPGVAEVYDAIMKLFDIPAVMAVGGIGYSAVAATAIVKNSIDMKARTESGFPIEEQLFQVKGTWDFTTPPKDIKVTTPIGDMPPSLGGEKAPASPGGAAPAEPKKPEDPIAKNLERAEQQEIINGYVLSQQEWLTDPLRALERSRQEEGRRKRKKPASAPAPRFKTRAGAPSPGAFDPDVAHAGTETPGRALAPSLRARLEPALGIDLGRVRIHSDREAAAAADGVHARAYAIGTDLVFGPGQYAPGTTEGLRLLAHELAHVAQQAAPEGRARTPGHSLARVAVAPPTGGTR